MIVTVKGGTVRYRVRRGKDGTEHGSWEAILRYKDDSGKWHSTSKAIKTYPQQTADGRTIRSEILTPTKSRPTRGHDGAVRALEEWKAELAAKLEGERRRAAIGASSFSADASAPRISPNVTVYEYVDAFLRSRKIQTPDDPSGIARSTYDGYRYAAVNMKRGFGSAKLKDLTPALVGKWQKMLEDEGKKGATINRAYWCLKSACEHAVAVGDMESERYAACFPSKRPDAPRSGNPDPNPLDEGSLQMLNMMLARFRRKDDAGPFAVSVELALLTGMRRGEICGLRWKDVDLGGDRRYPTGSIHVCNVTSKAGGKYIEKTPKTKSSLRWIPLNDDLKAVLEQRRDVQARELRAFGMDLDLYGGNPPLDYHVTGDLNGGFFDPDALTHQWAAFAKANDITGIKDRIATFHDLRHTFATQAIHQGIDVEVVSKILGHKRVSMTLDIYADAMPSAKTEGMAAMNGVLLRRR